MWCFVFFFFDNRLPCQQWSTKYYKFRSICSPLSWRFWESLHYWKLYNESSRTDFGWSVKCSLLLSDRRIFAEFQPLHCYLSMLVCFQSVFDLFMQKVIWCLVCFPLSSVLYLYQLWVPMYFRGYHWRFMNQNHSFSRMSLWSVLKACIRNASHGKTSPLQTMPHKNACWLEKTYMLINLQLSSLLPVVPIKLVFNCI